MSDTQTRNETSAGAPRAGTIDFTIEIVLLPVTDVDRAKRFYASLGWRIDIDYSAGDDYRVIQFTPTGSACSIMFGKGITAAAPGSVQSLHLVVSDILAAREDLLSRGVDVSEPFHDTGGIFHHVNGKGVVTGPHPERRSYASYVSFNDPDGNGWVVQEITARVTGRIEEGDARFTPELGEYTRRVTTS